MQLIPDNIDFAKHLKDRESQKIMPASDWRDAVKQRIDGTDYTSGDLLPWQKTHKEIQLRPGEVSLWAGINGHGKSLILGQVMLWVVRHSRILIASMEMKPEATIARMLRQASGQHHPAKKFIDGFLDWSDERFWIYDQQDSVATDKILGMAAYAGDHLKINHIVIDSLMKCGMAPDDYGAQKRFVDRLCWLAKSTGAHIHLVAHMRKGKQEGDKPDKFDVKGASEITDLVDNVFIVHRDKGKEEKIAKGKYVDVADPDTSLTVAKQRHGEWEGGYALWFDPKSTQFVPKPEGRALPWPSPEQQFNPFGEKVQA